MDTIDKILAISDNVFGSLVVWLGKRCELLGYLGMVIAIIGFVAIRVFFVFIPAYICMLILWIILVGLTNPGIYFVIVLWVIIFFYWRWAMPKLWKK